MNNPPADWFRRHDPIPTDGGGRSGSCPRNLNAYAAVALLTAATLACGPGQQEREIEFRVPVGVSEVGTGSVEDLIVATGTLRAPEAVTLVAESPGRLTIARAPNGRRLAEGDRVQAGQLLAEITGEDARLAAAKDSALRRYETLKAELARRQSLFDEGLIPEEELRKAEAAFSDAELQRDRAQLIEERNKLVTPIAGVLLRLARDAEDQHIAEGQLVTMGLEVAEVAPIDALTADVDLVGPEMGRARVGQRARIRHAAWESQSFPGTVTRLAPSVDPRTRTFRVEVTVDNAAEQLRPGMFVEVTIVVEQREEVPVVPREALTERGGERVVFVLDGQRVKRREVVLGLGDDDIVEIREGLEPGERVVVRGLETLTDGTRVRVSEG